VKIENFIEKYSDAIICMPYTISEERITLDSEDMDFDNREAVKALII